MLDFRTCRRHEGIGLVNATWGIHQDVLRTTVGHVVNWQSIDLVDVEDGVDPEKWYGPCIVVIGRGILVGELDRLGVNDRGAALALSNLSA